MNNRLIKILLLGFFFIFCGCGVGNLEKNNIQYYEKLVLIDSTSLSNNSKSLEYSKDYNIAYYPVFYVGKQRDTICLGKDKVVSSSFRAKDYSAPKNFTFADSSKMSITIDTSISLTYTDTYRN
ncbi:MAG: hypothetical protein V4585_15225, partial [Bacteroidota bacterium]